MKSVYCKSPQNVIAATTHIPRWIKMMGEMLTGLIYVISRMLNHIMPSNVTNTLILGSWILFEAEIAKVFSSLTRLHKSRSSRYEFEFDLSNFV